MEWREKTCFQPKTRHFAVLDSKDMTSEPLYTQNFFDPGFDSEGP